MWPQAGHLLPNEMSDDNDGAGARKKPRVEEDGGTHTMTIRRMVREYFRLLSQPNAPSSPYMYSVSVVDCGLFCRAIPSAKSAVTP